jgi:act minimal PKS chain-length factor (CLF/KS beta)
VSGAAYLTGLGVAAPNGLGAAQFWEATLAGRSGITEITRFDADRYPARLAGQILDFRPRAHLPDRLLLQTDVSTQLALAAADWALADAAVQTSALADYDMGVVTSTALGGFEFNHREFNKLWSEGPEAVSVYEAFAWFYAVNTGQISIRNGLRGPAGALVAEQAGGLDAIGHARRIIRRGARLVLAGGVDSAFDPWGWVAQLSSGRVSQDPDPRRAYRPFCRDACGYLPGEGGAFLVLEDAAAAARRGAAVYGEIAGYAATFDPPPGSPRPPALGKAIELALEDAGLAPGQVGVVFADAAGVPALDRAEAAAISAVFGPRSVPVTAPKVLTGRLYAGGGPLDVAAAALALREGVIPATAVAGEVPGYYGIDLVTGHPRTGQPLSSALILARGRCGFNSAIVLRAVPCQPPTTETGPRTMAALGRASAPGG